MTNPSTASYNSIELFSLQPVSYSDKIIAIKKGKSDLASPIPLEIKIENDSKFQNKNLLFLSGTLIACIILSSVIYYKNQRKKSISTQ